jgi:hypothetical protein
MVGPSPPDHSWLCTLWATFFGLQSVRHNGLSVHRHVSASNWPRNANLTSRTSTTWAARSTCRATCPVTIGWLGISFYVQVRHVSKLWSKLCQSGCATCNIQELCRKQTLSDGATLEDRWVRHATRQSRQGHTFFGMSDLLSRTVIPVTMHRAGWALGLDLAVMDPW